MDEAPQTPVEGPSFPVFLKLVASAMVALLLVAGVQAAREVTWAPLGWRGLLVLLIVLLVIASGLWAVLVGRTRVDERSVRQRGLRTREVQLADITQVKLIHVRGLEWLLVPRLVVRARGLGGFTTFQSADPQVLKAFRRLAGRPD